MSEPIRIELPTQFGMQSVNAYLFLEPEPVLIDCGEKSDAVWDALQTALAEYNLAIKDIKKVIITHCHVDHIGMAATILENSEAELWISEYGYDWAVNPDKMQGIRYQVIKEYLDKLGTPPEDSFLHTFKSLYKMFSRFWGAIPAERVHAFPMTGQLSFGGKDWEIIYAPGHCINQVCFYEPETQYLLSADMLLSLAPSPVIDATIEAPHKRIKALPILLESYQKMAALNVSTVFPGHYTPFTNHRLLIEKQVTRIHQRTADCFALIEGGTTKFWDLLNVLYAGRISFPAVPMLIGYLDLLELKGEIITQESEAGLNFIAK